MLSLWIMTMGLLLILEAVRLAFGKPAVLNVKFSILAQNGEIQVFDAVNLKAVAVIPAHDSPLAALAFNSSGTKLASASTTVSICPHNMSSLKEEYLLPKTVNSVNCKCLCTEALSIFPRQ